MNQIYVINDSLFFDEAAQTLSLNGEDENTLLLPSPAVRLLSELIKNNGNLVSRDEILSRVWGEYGFRASNSNLNNYLSILRKQIAALEPQANIITTLPKQGVVFSADVTLLNNPQSGPGDSPEAMPDGAPTGARWWRYLGYGLLVTGALLVLGALGHQFINARRALPLIPVPLSNRDHCHFYALPDSMLPEGLEQRALNIMGIQLDCQAQPLDVVVGYSSHDSSQRSMTFVAWCQRGADRRYNRCENVKLQRWNSV